MGKNKKNKSSIWKNPVVFGPIAVAIVAGIFELLPLLIKSNSPPPPPSINLESKGDKSPPIVAQDNSQVSVTFNEASPELLDRLERANIDRGKQAQLIEELKEKLKETEIALKERKAPESAIEKFKAGDYEEAEKLFIQEAKEKTKKAAESYYYLGNIKLAQLKFDEALKYYLQATQLEPKDSLYLNEVGFVYNIIAQHEKAIEFYEKALAIKREFLGADHPSTKLTKNNLENCKKAAGKL